MRGKTLVLFDFDGTLTKGDSLWRFLWFALGPHASFLGAFRGALDLLVLYISGNWTRNDAKETLVGAFLKGKSKASLFEAGREFYIKKIPKLWRSNIYNLMLDYKKTGARVVVISASLDIWLAPMAENEGIDCICTELEFVNGVFSGKLKTPNCRGEEKVKRLQELLEIKDFDKIIAYGNSSGDKEMLALAHEPHWI